MEAYPFPSLTLLCFRSLFSPAPPPLPPAKTIKKQNAPSFPLVTSAVTSSCPALSNLQNPTAVRTRGPSPETYGTLDIQVPNEHASLSPWTPPPPPSPCCLLPTASSLYALAAHYAGGHGLRRAPAWTKSRSGSASVRWCRPWSSCTGGVSSTGTSNRPIFSFSRVSRSPGSREALSIGHRAINSDTQHLGVGVVGGQGRDDKSPYCMLCCFAAIFYTSSLLLLLVFLRPGV